jgi:hypothetical protein
MCQSRGKYSIFKIIVDYAIVAKLAAFILEYVIGIFGKKSPVSIESMQSAYKQLSYSNKKARERFNYTFYSIDESINNAINGRFDV